MKKINNRKPVIKYDARWEYLDHYDSATTAAAKNGLTTSLLSAAIKNKVLSGGFFWKHMKFSSDIWNE